MNILKFDDFFPDNVAHGFFGRQGGVSTGLYDSLNCGLHSLDSPEYTSENRRRVLKAMGGTEISTLKQIHSANCFSIENSGMSGAEEGDALVTKTPGQVIGALAADCGPVLFYGEDGRGAPVIGAAHAGWGGALKGVLESTIKAMINLGADIHSMKAALGPCIGPMSYEVGEEFLKPFIEEDKRAVNFFRGAQVEQKFLFNLPAYIHFRLNRAGVGQILTSGIDTYSSENDYFSYRRATHRGEVVYGRQISAISIRSA
jgi:YfiH family protein